MPLKPNLIEHFAINWDKVPGIMMDMGIPLFQLFALLGAMEIGIFRQLRDEPADISSLSDRMDASERGLQVLIKALIPLGYVKEKNGTYHLSSMAEDMPIDKLEIMAAYFKDQAIRVLQGLGRGIKEAPDKGVYGWEHVKSGDAGRGYQASMRWLASSMVDQVVKKIKLPKGAEKMLDVGGSHGLYTVAFCKKYPVLKGTVLDWQIGLEEAEKTLEQNPEVADRIDLVECDFEREELPEGYDFAFLGNIIHGLNREGNRQLFEKLSQATTEHAMIGIQDQFEGMKGSQFSKAVAGLAGLNLFLFSGGRTYSTEKVSKWLSETGFTNSKVHSLSQPGMSLLISKKQ